MIDIFMRGYAKFPLRKAMAEVVRQRLNQYPGITVNILTEGMMNGRSYHIESKRLAEQMARSQIYCVIDSDQLPIGDDFFSLGVQTLTEHHEYGMMAGFPLEYGLAGQPYAGLTGDVVEAHAIGCPYFVRKGILSFPDGPLRQYDGILSKVVTDQGLKTGFALKAVYNHIGYGFSEVGLTD